MFQQVIDFREESEALYGLLAPLGDPEFETKTLFKGWTINQVIGHLHMWNWAADLSLKGGSAFPDFYGRVTEARQKGKTLREFEKEWRGGASGKKLLGTWRSFFHEMSERFGAADPKARVKWAGPDMSVRSSITARLMETWAHGQAVYDVLGVERVDGDRIRNVAVLGVNTFGWTFANRGLEVPADVPYVRLTAPSGEAWEWNETSATNFVQGSATEFCQVVAQTRNIADTRLRVVGETATRWMAIAQCFAGPPEEPPAPGSRYVKH